MLASASPRGASASIILEPQDTLLLRRLLDARPVASLATHTRDLQEHPRASLLVMAEADGTTAPQALPRIALQVHARALPRDGGEYEHAKTAYLARFPDSAVTFDLADFSIVALAPLSARLVAGFGRAQGLAGEALREWLQA